MNLKLLNESLLFIVCSQNRWVQHVSLHSYASNLQHRSWVVLKPETGALTIIAKCLFSLATEAFKTRPVVDITDA